MTLVWKVHGKSRKSSIRTVNASDEFRTCHFQNTRQNIYCFSKFVQCDACNLVDIHQCFEGICCLHLHGRTLTLTMEIALSFSETCVITYWTTRCHKPEEDNFCSHHREGFVSFIFSQNTLLEPLQNNRLPRIKCFPKCFPSNVGTGFRNTPRQSSFF